MKQTIVTVNPDICNETKSVQQQNYAHKIYTAAIKIRKKNL